MISSNLNNHCDQKLGMNSVKDTIYSFKIKNAHFESHPTSAEYSLNERYGKKKRVCLEYVHVYVDVYVKNGWWSLEPILDT